MPWITNVSYFDIINGNHPYEPNTGLIQIVDPAMPFPEPKFDFDFVERFEFLDADISGTDMDEFVIMEKQADQLADILFAAFEQNQNVLVHCVAGLCRSGAVTEVGIIIGFDDKFLRPRIPNVTVKNMLIRSLKLWG